MLAPVQTETPPYKWRSIVGLYRIGRLCGNCGQLSAFNALTDQGWRCYKGNCCLATTPPDLKAHELQAKKDRQDELQEAKDLSKWPYRHSAF